jgi:putative flippase GtrA
MIKWIKSVVDEKLLKFVIVGVINTLVGTSIMFGLYNLAGCGYWFSSVANYFLTSILSFFLNKYFTFKNKEKSLSQVVRFALNIAVCYLLAYGIAKPLTLRLLAGTTKSVQENVAMFVGMCLFTGFNYLGQRFFAFAEKKEN